MNKIAVVTGASRGIGKAVAEYLAQQKYVVILLARDENLLTKVYNQIVEQGGKASFYSLDVSCADKVRMTIEKIVTIHKKIDLLFNNAAILKRGTIEIADESIEELIKINLNGAISVAKYVAQQMKRQGEGYIINVSSLGGKIAASFAGIYAASKFGLSGFSEALSKEMAAYGVKVTNLCPSMVATEMAKGRKFLPEEMIQPGDIVKTVDYLLSLSKNALPTELCISCLPLIQRTSEALYKLYLN